MRRLLSWLLIALYVAAFAVLGSGFIFVSSLEVATSFDVYGRTVLRPGQPAHFRVWARSNETLDGLAGRRVELALVAPDGSLAAEAVTSLENDGSGLLALEVPSGLAPADGWRVRAVLGDPGSRTELDEVELDVTLAHAPAEALEVRDAGTTTPGELQGEGALVVELFASGPWTTALIEDDVFVRVIDRATGHPVAGASVVLEKTWGQLSAEAPAAPLVTDAAGLAVFPIAALGDTDWSLSATALDGRSGSARQTLVTAAVPLELEPRGWQLLPGQRLTLEAAMVRESDIAYLDVFSREGAWIAAHRQHLSAGGATTASWLPRGVGVPEGGEPELVTLVGCFAPVECAESHVRLGLLWTGRELSQAAQLRALLEHLRDPPRHQRWAAQVLAALEGPSPPSREVGARVLRFVAARAVPDFVGAQLLVRSEEAAQARLDVLKDEFRTWGSVLLVVLLVAGGLMISTYVIGSTAQRRRAMSAVLDEDDPEDSGDAPAAGTEDAASAAARARRQALGFALEIATLIVVIAAFAAGIVLLMRML